MRSVLFHCKNYGVKFDSLANRPVDVAPEKVKEEEQSNQNCVVSLITVEKGDDIEQVSKKLAQEIIKMAKDVGRDNVVIAPFAHLSNNLADSKTGIAFFDLLEQELKELNVMRTHFGSHKSLLLDIAGHPGNVRYREF